MHVLMTGGGTGGHVNPALAIANTIKLNNPAAEIAFVGTSRGIENKLVPKAGYPLYHVEVRGFRRSLSPSNLKAAWLAFISPIKAKKLIAEFKPDIVIGTGGYACWPVLVAASRMGIPCAVHESNALPGMTVRRLQPYVDRIWLNFAEAAERLDAKDKLVVVGNPLRAEFGSMSRDQARAKLGLEHYRKIILSCGGSLGAEPINDAMLALMRDYGREHPDVMHIHATGALEYEAAKAKFEEYGLEGIENLCLTEYIYDMPVRMAAADLVVNRAGAMTLSELAVQRKACLLIPSPYVADNHQYKNAKVLADAGAALLIEEKDLSPERIVREVSSLLDDDERLAGMENAIAVFARDDVNRVIYREILQLIEQKKK
ncbi:MAG: undecaprenyldiphospho-muramoylpentapeptide beta-N-acetylglucosaminyltransferase [Clostridia bacterium]|nr:undecaprenyldiphospho-muramoylpentapeptide beta-N-acetylglucosaminyltransferase [Clostridia bacterium]